VEQRKAYLNFEYYRVVDCTVLGATHKKEGKPKVVFQYKRNEGFVGFPSNSIMPFPKGGKTVCKFYYDNELVAEKEALCSMSEHFKYSRGREITIGRLLKKYKYSNSEEKYLAIKEQWRRWFPEVPLPKQFRDK